MFLAALSSLPPYQLYTALSITRSELVVKILLGTINVVYLGGEISQQDWTNHPRFNRWKRLLECQYEASDFITLLKNGGTEEERRAFARWAIDNGVVKLPEGVTVDGL